MSQLEVHADCPLDQSGIDAAAAAGIDNTVQLSERRAADDIWIGSVGGRGGSCRRGEAGMVEQVERFESQLNVSGSVGRDGNVLDDAGIGVEEVGSIEAEQRQISVLARRRVIEAGGCLSGSAHHGRAADRQQAAGQGLGRYIDQP